VRQLIDGALGCFSGSVYNDYNLLDFLPGEYRCSDGMTVIKAHPNYNHFDDLFVANQVPKCSICGIQAFDSAVVVVRHPVHSLWSEVQLVLTRSHVGRLSAERLRSINHSVLEQKTMRIARQHLFAYMHDLKRVRSQIPETRRLLVRFEDLQGVQRITALRKILSFLSAEFNASDAFLEGTFTKASHAKRRSQSGVNFEDAYTPTFRRSLCDLFQDVLLYNYSSA